MGWDDLIRTGLGIADAILGDGLQATVQHYAATGKNTYGEATLNPVATARRAVVSDTNEAVRTQRGEVVVASYRVQFLGAVAVGLSDKIVLPDGRSAPILRVDGGVLDDAGNQLATAVICG